MNERVKALIEEARKLTPEERCELFESLESEFRADLSDISPEDIEAAWREEIERRVTAYERGEAQFYNADEVIEQARARVRTHRS